MDQYIVFRAFINVAALVVMIVFASVTRAMNRTQKNSFIIVFCMIITIIAAELVTVCVNGKDPDYRWMNNLANYIGFLCTALLPFWFGEILGGFKRVTLAILLTAGLGIVLALTVRYPIIFYVDENNLYSRSNFYWAYILICLLGIVYLFINTIRFCVNYQYSNKIVVIFAFLFLVIGTAFQILIPSSYITWSCLTIVSIIYFAYRNDLWFQVDGLTRLLSHSCYLIDMESPGKDIILILMDVDYFKNVNDTYGHLYGDRCLIRIAQILQQVYGRQGHCYRIGGDEFAVILSRNLTSFDTLNDEFLDTIRREQDCDPRFPSVSFGFAHNEKGKSPVELINAADKALYLAKSLRSYTVR